LRPRKSIRKSFAHALDGVLFVVRTQKHMQVHLVIMILVLLSALGLEVTRLELLGLFLSISLVLVAEMLNTAVETAVDLTVRAYHPIARVVKDVAAGGVLVASVNAVLAAAIVFATNPKLKALVARVRFYSQAGAGPVLLSAVALILVTVIVLKIRGRRGTILRGGVVSGHTALAFFLATSISFLTGEFPVAVLAIMIALLVAQSRVEADIHSLPEVVWGGLVGLAITLIAFLTPSLVRGWLPMQ